MAHRSLPELSPWKRQSLTIPPDSLWAWATLFVWEFWIGMLISGALMFGGRLLVIAPRNIVTVYDFANCYATPPVSLPCERVAYRAGVLNLTFNVWCGLLLVAVAAWLLWELWTAVAPKPITDDFLKLLDDSFGRNWRSVWNWPWARIGWAYGFTCVGAATALLVGQLLATVISSRPPKVPTVHVETSYHLGQVQ